MSIREELIKMKADAPFLAASPAELRDGALKRIKTLLTEQAEKIFEANKRDLEAADMNKVPAAVKKRLSVDAKKLEECLAGIDQLLLIPDPLQKVTLARELDEGLRLYRTSCPIGIIGIIFEARPDALIQISSLCIKSGNCAVLKGGKETSNTNRELFGLIHRAAAEAGIPAGCYIQAESHAEIDELLLCHELIDLLVPRGSNEFVQHIMNSTKIPVMGHADGICHIYVDRDADIKKAIPVIIDSKTQYTAACNAVETLLINRDIAESFLPLLDRKLKEQGVKLRGTGEVCRIIDAEEIEDGGFVEYLDLIASVKLVKDAEEAVEHINSCGSHHTDCIITENAGTAGYFMQRVDSAGVYQNCSTRFADGFRYGFGAELGISTGKLHARGPVGLEGLLTYKYRLFGDGHIVGDYAAGKRSFHFRDI